MRSMELAITIKRQFRRSDVCTDYDPAPAKLSNFIHVNRSVDTRNLAEYSIIIVSRA